MKILMISPALPVPPTSGGAIRVFNLLRRLSAQAEIDFAALDDGTTSEADLKPLRACCGNVFVIVPKKRTRWADFRLVAGKALRGEPFFTKYVDYPEFRSRLGEITRTSRYDILHFEHSHLACLLASSHAHDGTRTILSTENVAFDQFRRMAAHESDPVERIKLWMTAAPMRRWEPRMAAAFDGVVAVCERDRELLRQARPELEVAVIPNGVDVESHIPHPRSARKENILIVGSMDYQPNVDAALHFHNAIFPLIRRRIPGCTLTVAGRNPPPALCALHAPPTVTVQANPPDVKPFYRDAMAAAVALRSGGGSRLKILEAMAMGTPVVSTEVGCEGLDVRDGETILMADSPETFAQRVETLMRNPDLWTELAERGLALVRQQYDWKSIADALMSHYRECLARPRIKKGTS